MSSVSSFGVPSFGSRTFPRGRRATRSLAGVAALVTAVALLLLPGTVLPVSTSTSGMGVLFAPGIAHAQEAASTGGAAPSGGFVKDLPSEVPDAPPPPIVRPDSDFLSLATRAGGTMFWLLMIMGLLGIVITIERLLTLGRGNVDVSRFMGEVSRGLQAQGVSGALEVCSRSKGPVSSVVQYGLARASRGVEGVEKAVSTASLSQLVSARRGLGVLNFFAQTAPLIGFVSTFMGILNAFNAAIDSNRVMAAQAIGGLAEAVVPTVGGLAVAIVANVCINIVSARIDRLSVQLEEAGDELADALHTSRGNLKGRTA